MNYTRDHEENERIAASLAFAVRLCIDMGYAVGAAVYARMAARFALDQGNPPRMLSRQ